jgi:hypothetical protein
MSFQSVDAVEAWAEANGGPEALREAVAQGRFGADKRALACIEEWFRRLDAEREKMTCAEEWELRRREVVAQESAAESAARAAQDATRSADAAETSARWTKAAALLAAIAVGVSLVAYLRPPH